METSSVQLVIISISVFTLLAAMYFLFYKVRVLESINVQTQKHVMYQQQILEKHNNILQTLTIGHQTNFETVNVSPRVESPLVPPEVPPVATEEKKEEEKKQSVPNILPVLSTIMGLMNNTDMGGDDMEETSDDEEENEKKKLDMAQEIEKELNELQIDDAPEKLEGRVEEEEVKPVVEKKVDTNIEKTVDIVS
jgi:hypothetical protein